MAENHATIDGWYIVELMGHRRLAGRVSEVTVAGAGFLRIDVPGDAGQPDFVTQFVRPESLYALTPTTEALARQVARLARPAPVSRYELPAEAPPSPPRADPAADDEDDDDDGSPF